MTPGKGHQEVGGRGAHCQGAVASPLLSAACSRRPDTSCSGTGLPRCLPREGRLSKGPVDFALAHLGSRSAHAGHLTYSPRSCRSLSCSHSPFVLLSSSSITCSSRSCTPSPPSPPTSRS